MKKYFFSLPIILVMLFSYNESIKFSQIVIEGTVLTEGSLKPVEDAYVYTVSGEEEVLTDKNGKFRLITWQSLPVVLTVVHNRYETQKVNICKLPANQSVRLKRK